MLLCVRPSGWVLSTVSFFFLFLSPLYLIYCLLKIFADIKGVLLIDVSIVQERDIFALHLPAQLCKRTKNFTLYFLLIELHQLCIYLQAVSPLIYRVFIVESYVSVMQLGYFCCLYLVPACLSKSIIITFFAITWYCYKFPTLDSCQ